MIEFIDKYLDFKLIVSGVATGLIIHIIIHLIKNKEKVGKTLEKIVALEFKISLKGIVRICGLFFLLSTSVFCLLGAIVILFTKISEGLVSQAFLGFMFLTLLSIYFGFLCHHLRYKTSPTKYTFLIAFTSLIYGVATIIFKYN